MVKPTICNSDSKTPSIPEFCDDGLWEVPVNSLSEIKKADRDHAYILPDDSVWVLSHDGINFIKLNIGGASGGQPTQVSNTDGLISIGGNGTFDVSVDLEVEKVSEQLGISEIKDNVSNKQDKLTAGNGISIDENNKIASIGQIVKVTQDSGSALIQVLDTETILNRVIQAGAGLRTGTASSKVADNSTNTNLIMFVSNMVTTSGGYVIGVNTAGAFWVRTISASKWSGDWQRLASTSQAQMSKVTADDGAVFQSITSGSLLDAVVANKAGVRNYHAYGNVTDKPSNSVYRFIANVTAFGYGNVIGMDDLGDCYVRAFANSKWVGDWHGYNLSPMLFQPLQIKAEDWNTLKVSGIHWVAGATGTNRPRELATYGYLEIFNSSGAVIQRFTSNANEIATRYYSPSADSWSGWVKVLSSKDKPVGSASYGGFNGSTKEIYLNLYDIDPDIVDISITCGNVIAELSKSNYNKDLRFGNLIYKFNQALKSNTLEVVIKDKSGNEYFKFYTVI